MSFLLENVQWHFVHIMRGEVEAQQDMTGVDWSSLAQIALSPVGPKGDSWVPMSQEEMEAILNGPSPTANETFMEEVNREAYLLSTDDCIRFAAWLLDTAPGYVGLDEVELNQVLKQLDEAAMAVYDAHVLAEEGLL